ncbi:MAG: trehalose-phosphatase [Anaerolineae bacterium]
MKHWREALDDVLAPLPQAERLGLVTDVDGTISPIVADPDAAQVTPRNRALLQALAECLPLVAVISGRAVDDVRARVGISDLVYIGNHGLEWAIADRTEAPPEAQAHRPALQAALQAARRFRVPGLYLEDKGVTVSIHYRQCPDPDAVAAQLEPLLADIAAAQGLRLFAGRRVFELRPPLAIDKGVAFARLVERYRLEAAVYLGDDTTDADALQTARRLRQQEACYALGLAVLSADTPDIVRAHADLSLLGVEDAEEFFAWLLKARSASST